MSGDLAVRILLLCGIAVLAIFTYWVWKTSRVAGSSRSGSRAPSRRDVPNRAAALDSNSPRRPEPEGEFTTPVPASSRGRVYRPPPAWSEGGPKWDPFDETQSRAQRLQSGRRAVRATRSGGSGAGRRRSFAGPTYYELLGVAPDAALPEIERSYRRVAASIHPDRYAGDLQRQQQAHEDLKRVNNAMAVLRDPVRRREYDELI